MRLPRIAGIATLVATSMGMTLPAAADSITLDGSTIAMRNVKIQQISSGRVFYIDARGTRQRRPLSEVAAIGFDDLPMLDEAEQALRAGENDRAMARFLLAMHEADEDVERIWMHRRLAQVHDLRGEFVQSAGHAAAAVALDPTLAWRQLLEPRSAPDTPAWPAATESLHRLEEARSAVRDQTLRSAIETLLAVVRPIEQQTRRSYDGPAVDPRTTISGYRTQDIEAGELPGLGKANASDDTANDAASTGAGDIPPPMSGDPNQARAPRRDGPPTIAEPEQRPNPTVESTAPAVIAPTAPERIDALLAGGSFDEAVALCETIAADPGNRSIPQFLVQYGKALLGVDRPKDAAVMFTRAAVLYPRSSHGIVGLIETARIYRATLGQPQTARRLLEVAIERAEQLDQPDLGNLAGALLADLPAPTDSRL